MTGRALGGSRFWRCAPEIPESWAEKSQLPGKSAAKMLPIRRFEALRIWKILPPNLPPPGILKGDHGSGLSLRSPP